jgi:hypothetical protein
MSWFETIGNAARLPDPRPTGVVEQEILDELEFHLDMRTQESVMAGMSADEARRNAIQRFGDFERIRKKCRQALLGERIMLQRIQTVLTVVLLGAVLFLGVAFYRGQRANEAATARLTQLLDRLVGPSVIQTVPHTGDTNVDPSLAKIRVTYDREMSDGSWSWCYDPGQLIPAGEPRYESDHKTCVLPVKLEPGKSYVIQLNSGEYRNFKDAAGQSAVPYLLRFTTRK